MQLSLKKRVVAGSIAFGLAATALVGVGQTTTAAPASADTCTDSAVTLGGATYYNQVAQVRNSPNCGGSVWMRINANGGPVQGGGTVTLQLRTRSGNIINAYSHSTNGFQSWVGPYRTGYKAARLHYVGNAGSLPDSYTAWYGVGQAAR